MDTRPVEQRLRAALAARAEQVKPEELRPSGAPLAPMRRTARPARRFLLALAAPATLAVVLSITIGVWWFAGRSADRGPEAAGSPGAATAAAVVPSDAASATSDPVTITASPRTGTVPGTSAGLTYPVFTVSGGTAAVSDEIRQRLTEHVTNLVDAYRRRDGVRMVEITAGATAHWERYVSVRLDTIDDFGGAHGNNTTTAVVIDTRTGAPAAAADLFTDVGAVDDVMRSAIGHQPGIDDPTEVRTLTMSASDGEFAWYPAADGLHWVLDRCAYAACAAGQPEAVVAWTELTALVKDGS